MITQTAFIIYDIYDVRPDDVNLEVLIGNGQIGSSLLKLDNTLLGNFDNSFEYTIGENQALKSKTLNIFTTIHDIQPDTDKINLSIKLKGGKKDHEQVIINSTVPQSGGIATGVVTIIFI